MKQMKKGMNKQNLKDVQKVREYNEINNEWS